MPAVIPTDKLTGVLAMNRVFAWILFLIIAIACDEPPKGQVQELGSISVRVPEGWKTETPSSRMRKAQYSLKSPTGEGESATLVVFYFGRSQGGSVSANLERWYGQFRQPDGRPSREVASVTKTSVSGMQVTVADVSGTYAPSAMGPMMPRAGPKPDYRMLAAIVESQEGPYFFKLTGPIGTVTHWQASFDEFIGSVSQK